MGLYNVKNLIIALGNQKLEDKKLRCWSHYQQLKVATVFSLNISIEHALQHEHLHVKHLSKMVHDISFQMEDYDINVILSLK